MSVELPPSPRLCRWCDKPMPSGKRPHAVYCTRKCKAASAETRRPNRDDQARYLKERDHRIAYQTEYLKRNPDVAKRAKNKRRARKTAAGVFVVTSKDWRRVVDRQRGECFYCGRSRALSMDHVIPLSRGGRHSVGNIVAACMPCNSSKRTRYITEWRRRDRVSAAASTLHRPNLG